MDNTEDVFSYELSDANIDEIFAVISERIKCSTFEPDFEGVEFAELAIERELLEKLSEIPEKIQFVVTGVSLERGETVSLSLNMIQYMWTEEMKKHLTTSMSLVLGTVEDRKVTPSVMLAQKQFQTALEDSIITFQSL